MLKSYDTDINRMWVSNPNNDISGFQKNKNDVIACDVYLNFFYLPVGLSVIILSFCLFDCVVVHLGW